VKQLVDMREQARKTKKFSEADKLRIQIEALGFVVQDVATGSPVVLRKR